MYNSFVINFKGLYDKDEKKEIKSKTISVHNIAYSFYFNSK